MLHVKSIGYLGKVATMYAYMGIASFSPQTHFIVASSFNYSSQLFCDQTYCNWKPGPKMLQ